MGPGSQSQSAFAAIFPFSAPSLPTIKLRQNELRPPFSSPSLFLHPLWRILSSSCSLNRCLPYIFQAIKSILNSRFKMQKRTRSSFRHWIMNVRSDCHTRLAAGYYHAAGSLDLTMDLSLFSVWLKENKYLHLCGDTCQLTRLHPSIHMHWKARWRKTLQEPCS